MNILVLEKVSYGVQSQTILKEITLTIPDNSYLTISGPSGSGKSTLLKLIASLLTPTHGTIYFNQKRQAEYEITAYRQQVSYCFQQPSLFGLTVADNLSFPFTVQQKPIDQRTLAAALEKVALPQSYLTKRITELSGGEKQRVALLRNTLLQPKVLLLDEVTTGLDSQSRQIVLEFLRQLHIEGMTLLQITHDSQELKQAAAVIWIEKGVLRHES